MVWVVVLSQSKQPSRKCETESNRALVCVIQDTSDSTQSIGDKGSFCSIFCSIWVRVSWVFGQRYIVASAAAHMWWEQLEAATTTRATMRAARRWKTHSITLLPKLFWMNWLPKFVTQLCYASVLPNIVPWANVKGWLGSFKVYLTPGQLWGRQEGEKPITLLP